MPVANQKNKTNNYDVVIKSLRGREVSCLVAAVPPIVRSQSVDAVCNWSQKITPEKKYNRINEDYTPGTLNPKKCSKMETNFSTESSVLFTPTNKRAYYRKSLTNSKRKLLETYEIPKKRVYRKKSENRLTKSDPKEYTSVSVFHLDNINKTQETKFENETPKKRVYRKKSRQLSDTEELRKSTSAESACSWVDDNANSPPTPINKTPREKKCQYKKILKVPSNTPVMFPPTSLSESTCTPSGLSQDIFSPTTTTQQKQFEKSLPSLLDDESTCTSSSVSQDSALVTGRRGRRSFWRPDSPEEEEISEYEMLRRKNIEENLKALRQMFADSGLNFEEKSEIPKSRKTYTKVPLPPPRPKSVRLEVRESLDFSRLPY